MSSEAPEISASDPKILLQQQVQLLQELNNRVAAIQNTQEQLELRVAGLKNESPSLAGRAEVLIKNFEMPFWSMVGLMIKWTFASIPAAIIVAVLVGLVMLLLGLTLGGLGGLAAWLMRLGR